MNRHTKIALFVAPLLIMGGYIMSDMYIESEAHKPKYFELKPTGHCDVLGGECILQSGEFKVNLYDKAGTTWLNSTFHLDRATLFLVDENGQPVEVKMAMGDNPFYWHRKTDLRELASNSGEGYTLRMVAEIKGGKYFAEFDTSPNPQN